MKALDHISNLRCYGTRPCLSATDWVRSLGPSVTLEQVWEQCTRGDWLVWYLDATDGWDDRLRRLFAIDCAVRALRREREVGREPDGRSWHAVAVARAFADGQATPEDMAAAWYAAWDAAWAAMDAAWYAAWVAWDAAWYAAWVAWDAAWYAAWVARDAAGAAAWYAEMGRQADWIRQHVPFTAAKEDKL